MPPKVRSQKTVSLCRANGEVDPAPTSVPSFAGARDPPCRRLHAALLPPALLLHNARVTLHSYSIEPYARATLNLREGLNQADRITEFEPRIDTNTVGRLCQTPMRSDNESHR